MRYYHTVLYGVHLTSQPAHVIMANGRLIRNASEKMQLQHGTEVDGCECMHLGRAHK